LSRFGLIAELAAFLQESLPELFRSLVLPQVRSDVVMDLDENRIGLKISDTFLLQDLPFRLKKTKTKHTEADRVRDN